MSGYSISEYKERQLKHDAQLKYEANKDMCIKYLEDMMSQYVEGYGYEAHPLPEWYALEFAINHLKNSILIPEKATNEDILRASFPNMDFMVEFKTALHFSLDKGVANSPELTAYRGWLRAPYVKRERTDIPLPIHTK